MDETGEVPVEPEPPTGRRVPRWAVIVVAVVVVVAAVGAITVLGGRLGSSSSQSGNGLGGPPGPTNSSAGRVEISGFDLTGQNLQVSHATLVGSHEVAPGGRSNFSVMIAPVCGAYGCAAQLQSLQLDDGFSVLGSTPTLPCALTTRTPVQVTFGIVVPTVAGNFSLAGTVVGSAPPGPVLLDGAHLGVAYSGNYSDYLNVSLGPTPSAAVPNATFDVNITASSNLSYPVTLSALHLAAPFTVAAVEPSLPLMIQPNSTDSFALVVRAPAPGQYSMNATLDTSIAPIVIIPGVNWLLTIVPDPFVALYPNFTGVPAYVAVGQVLTFHMEIPNLDSAVHAFELNRVYAPWILQSATPGLNSSYPIPADTTGVWTITVIAPSTAGTYSIGIALTDET